MQDDLKPRVDALNTPLYRGLPQGPIQRAHQVKIEQENVLSATPAFS